MYMYVAVSISVCMGLCHVYVCTWMCAYSNIKRMVKQVREVGRF